MLTFHRAKGRGTIHVITSASASAESTARLTAGPSVGMGDNVGLVSPGGSTKDRTFASACDGCVQANAGTSDISLNTLFCSNIDAIRLRAAIGVRPAFMSQSLCRCYRRCPSEMPILRACCRNAPSVLFVSFEILATGVYRSSPLIRPYGMRWCPTASGRLSTITFFKQPGFSGCRRLRVELVGLKPTTKVLWTWFESDQLPWSDTPSVPMWRARRLSNA